MTVTTTSPARERLESALLGESIHRVCFGEWWALQLSNGLWVVAQNLVAPEEADIRAVLATTVATARDAVDPETIPKGVAVLRRMRRRIVALDVREDASLHIELEGMRELRITTDSPIVDWQWALNRSGADPYRDFELACFASGEIELHGGEHG